MLYPKLRQCQVRSNELKLRCDIAITETRPRLVSTHQDLQHSSLHPGFSRWQPEMAAAWTIEQAFDNAANPIHYLVVTISQLPDCRIIKNHE